MQEIRYIFKRSIHFLIVHYLRLDFPEKSSQLLMGGGGGKMRNLRFLITFVPWGGTRWDFDSSSTFRHHP